MQNSGQPTPLRPEDAQFEPGRHASDGPGRDPATDPNDMTLKDVSDAEAGRPDLPGETADGLDEMDEEIRHQAEDLPTDAI